MRKFFKAFLVSTALLMMTFTNMLPNAVELNIPKYIMNEPQSIKQLRFKYNIGIREVYEITNYPILFPLKLEDTKRISSPFGRRVHPIFRYMTNHEGVDIAGKLGSPVMTTANGVVVKTKSVGGYGKQVLVDHGNGYMTRYAHLNEILVSKGDIVQMGQIVGELGSTGISTGPHLHYEIVYQGNPIDPMSIRSDTLNTETYLSQSDEINNYLLSYSDNV